MKVIRITAALALAALLAACPNFTGGGSPDNAAIVDTLVEGAFYVAPNGNDLYTGEIDAPFKTLKRAQEAVSAGGTVYIRGGTYEITSADATTYASSYWQVFVMSKSGNANQRITYQAYPGERPVFDLSGFKPGSGTGGDDADIKLNSRIAVFNMTGSYITMKGFDVVGLQGEYAGTSNYQCINFWGNGGSYNVYENIAVHDGGGIGWYFVSGGYNLVLNCDAYNQWDVLFGAENNDGFGGHVSAGDANRGNVFRNCRAWYNADDGFDFISCNEAFLVDNCWSFYNGFSTMKTKTEVVENTGGNGGGFKMGGWGMNNNDPKPGVDDSNWQDSVPKHTVRFSLAVGNTRHAGFYANHQLGGQYFYNNTSLYNGTNFNFVSRKSSAEAVDVPGYGHTIKNNLSYKPYGTKHFDNLDVTKSVSVNNSWDLDLGLTDEDFVDVDVSGAFAQLSAPRKPDGSLPDITLMKPSHDSRLIDRGVVVGAFPYQGFAPDLGCFEY